MQSGFEILFLDVKADSCGSCLQVFEAVSQIHDVPFGTYFEVLFVNDVCRNEALMFIFSERGLPMR